MGVQVYGTCEDAALGVRVGRWSGEITPLVISTFPYTVLPDEAVGMNPHLSFC